MKIISGKYKKATIFGYDMIGTRPTMNRVKESMIAMIQDYIKDSICLDLFAGSGQIGLELISNGAGMVYFVDNNYKVGQIIKQNIDKLKIKEAAIINLDYLKALKEFKDKKITFDIIYIDPPYKSHFISKAIDMIMEYNLLNEEGLIITESLDELIETNLEVYKEKKYGTKSIIIYKHKKA